MDIHTDSVATSWVTWEVRDLLTKAETMFGPRDLNFEFLGVSFGPTGPRTRFSPRDTRICIELESAALNTPNLLRFQGAHEVIHILAPNNAAPMLEEGLAVWFSLHGPSFGDAYSNFQMNRLRCSPSEKHYLDALNLYDELENAENNCVQRLRVLEPHFWKMTPALIREVLPSVSESLAERCCERRLMR